MLLCGRFHMVQEYLMSLSPQDRLVVEMQVQNEGPNLIVAYLLWFFLGLLSAHRFYLGRPKSAILQIVLNICIIGLLWTLFDVFLISGMAREKREQLRQKYTRQAAAHGGSLTASQ